jgi:hypothetical protein
MVVPRITVIGAGLGGPLLGSRMISHSTMPYGEAVERETPQTEREAIG